MIRLLSRLPLAFGLLVLLACEPAVAPVVPGASGGESVASGREAMLARLRDRGVDSRIIAAMSRVPREEFVDPSVRDRAYDEVVLALGEGQSMYEPGRIAQIAELLQLEGDEKVLEVGTGSGYFTAVLAELAREVFSIEILPSLRDRAEKRIQDLSRSGAIGSANRVRVIVGDGALGLPDEAPFDAIFLSVSSRDIPQRLIDQLAPGGRLVAPVGKVVQKLHVVTRSADGSAVTSEEHGFVRFDELLRRE